MHNIQFYSNNKFDRAAELREVHTHTTNASYIPIYNGDFFVIGNQEKTVLMNAPIEWMALSEKRYFLGIINAQEVWCIDLSEISFTTLTKYFSNAVLSCVRDCLDVLSAEEASLLAYAKGLATWNASQQFCGYCGAKTVLEEKGHRRKCNNTHCGAVHFPRINPAVIVLIEYSEKGKPPLCLLNMHKKEYGYMCSLFSGFSEIGESLEDTVFREMKEEVNVEVSDIQYKASQPWSFPASMMLGFTAKTAHTDFTIDNKEIKKAQWFSAHELKEMVQTKKLVISRKDSISHYMISQWMEQNS